MAADPGGNPPYAKKGELLTPVGRKKEPDRLREVHIFTAEAFESFSPAANEEVISDSWTRGIAGVVF